MLNSPADPLRTPAAEPLVTPEWLFDNVGHREAKSAVAEATTTLVPQQPPRARGITAHLVTVKVGKKKGRTSASGRVTFSLAAGEYGEKAAKAGYATARGHLKVK